MSGSQPLARGSPATRARSRRPRSSGSRRRRARRQRTRNVAVAGFDTVTGVEDGDRHDHVRRAPGRGAHPPGVARPHAHVAQRAAGGRPRRPVCGSCSRTSAAVARVQGSARRGRLTRATVPAPAAASLTLTVGATGVAGSGRRGAASALGLGVGVGAGRRSGAAVALEAHVRAGDERFVMSVQVDAVAAHEALAGGRRRVGVAGVRALDRDREAVAGAWSTRTAMTSGCPAVTATGASSATVW